MKFSILSLPFILLLTNHRAQEYPSAIIPSMNLQFLVISATVTYSFGFIFCYYILSSSPQSSSFEATKMSDIGKKLMDTFYISHGAPTLCIDDSLPARHFLKSFRKKVYKEKPAAILVISGHWDTREPIVNSVDVHETIYDFYGFPKSMYKLKYNAPGSPALAQRVKELLKASGVKQVKEDTKRGLDHGAWVPLMLMYPEAIIPIVQLSVQGNKDATYHYNIGKALAPLREEGVLIVGSGAATHNLRTMRHDDGTVDTWAEQFDNWLKDSLLNGRYDEVNNYRDKAPHAKVAHPHPDHFYPLHVAMGAAGVNSKAKLIHHSWSMGSLSYASYQFVSPN